MRYLFCFLSLSSMFLFISPYKFFSKPVISFNRIEGQVYDQNRVPVADVYVELLNDVNSLLSRTRTSSAGRFSFSGVSSGRFSIKVLPLGKNLLEQVQEVEVINIRPTSSDVVFVEFYLRPDKRASDVPNEFSPEAVFVQEIPQDARKLYKTGVDSLEKKQDKGLTEIEESIKMFPDYFDALNRLGKEYNSRKDYEKAYPYLLKAVNVNNRNYSTYYSLSFAFYRLGKMSDALEAAKAAAFINSASLEIQLLYGTLLKINGNFQDAEKSLLKAKSLAKKPNAEIHWQLALLYNKMNRNKAAADELETYLKILPDSPDKKKIQELILKLKDSKKSANS